MLGILMLQTRFPRLPGDIGHPVTWRMPVRYRTVPDRDQACADVLAAALRLQQIGRASCRERVCLAV